MKKIGFIDYYISEWHANNYPAWIAEASGKSGEDFKVAYAYAELDISPVDGRSTDEWCAHMGAQKCDSIEELCALSDYICILAPSNPEKHLEYCKKAFAFGKNTYVDKSFAKNLKEAEEILALGKRYGTKFFSTSALRYGAELSELSESESIIVSGMGSNFDEYIIHIAEIAVKLLGCDIKAVSSAPQGKEQCTVKVELYSGKSASLVFAPSMPYAVCSELRGGTSAYKAISGGYFGGLIEDMLRFFISGEPSFSGSETLAVMKLREAAIESRNKGGIRIEYPRIEW